MGRLGISVMVHAAIGDVYKQVTACDASGALDEDAAAKKYGRLLRKVDDVHIFEEERVERLQWRVTFEPPSRRVMESADPKWSDRTDAFEEAASGTRWTVTWHTKARGVVGLLQWVMFQLSGKKRAMREVVQPVLAALPPQRT
jgi:hypothetical protein